MDRITRIKNSMDVRQGLNNQAVGLLPLLLLIVLNYFYTYLVSFVIASIVCLISLATFWGLLRGRRYQFMLLPTAITLALYSLFLILRLDPVLYLHSPLLTEWLLVAVLSAAGFMQRIIIRRVRHSRRPALRQASLRTALNEFFFIARITQNAYTLHLFILLFHMILPEADQSLWVERLLHREAPLIIGVGIMVYEQIRLSMMKEGLAGEAWLPVVDVKGHVIGRVAQSVSLSRRAGHYRHPIVRIAVICDGMLYLTTHTADATSEIDLPLTDYVLFGRTPEQTARELTGYTRLGHTEAKPRLLISYPYDDAHVSRLISLYIVHLRSESALSDCTRGHEGKLWTPRQIDDNLHSGLFSPCFEQEYPYLRQTALEADLYAAASTTAPTLLEAPQTSESATMHSSPL